MSYLYLVPQNLIEMRDLMPIRIQADLPAIEVLESENIFVMTHERANVQDIRPLKIAILNLMPTKIETEKHQLLSPQHLLQNFL